MTKHFTNRQVKIIGACRSYVDAGAPGLPGHHLMLIISQLCKLVEDLLQKKCRPEKIRFDQQLYNGQMVTMVANPQLNADLCLHCESLHSGCAIVEAQEAFCRMVGLKVAVRQCPDFREVK